MHRPSLSFRFIGFAIALTSCGGAFTSSEGDAATVAETDAGTDAPSQIIVPSDAGSIAPLDATIADAASDGASAVDASTNDAAPCTAATDSDPENCGACGHSCLGGGCTNGLCQLFALATGQGDPIGLAVDATDVYFTTDSPGDVRVCSVQGCGSSPTVLVSPTEVAFPTSIVCDADTVYFTSRGALGAVTKASGSLVIFGPAMAGYDLAIDDALTSLAWVTQGSGSTPTKLYGASTSDLSSYFAILEFTGAQSLAIASGNVYWDGRYQAEFRENSSTIIGGGISGLTAGKNVIDGDTLYFAAEGAGTGYIVSATVSNDGQGATNFREIYTGGVESSLLAQDKDSLYWCSPNGAIQSLSKASPSTSVKTLATNQTNVTALVTDGNASTEATAIYWAVGGTSGSIMKVAK